MDLAATHDPRDHDPGHARMQKNSCSFFKSAESHGSLIKSPKK